MPRVLKESWGVGAFVWVRYPCQFAAPFSSGGFEYSVSYPVVDYVGNQYTPSVLKVGVQGHLAHKKQHPPRTLPQDYA